MKKFITRGTCFAVIGLALLFVVNGLYTRTNGFKSLDDTCKFNSVPDSIEVANLGSSHAEYAFDYAESGGLTGFNFALPGQNLYLDLQILKRYGNRLSKDCLVVIPLSYFSFVQTIDHNDQRTQYYRLLGYGSIPNHNPVEYIRFKLLPILSASFNAKYLVRDKESAQFFLVPSLLGTDVDEFRHYADLHFEYYRDITGRGGNEGFNIGMLEEIIAYCRQIGCRPVLATTPFTRYYNDKFSKAFYDEFTETIAGISERYDVPYLDYSHDPRFTEALELFVDSDHLNADGRAKFTQILLADVGMI